MRGRGENQGRKKQREAKTNTRSSVTLHFNGRETDRRRFVDSFCVRAGERALL